MKSTIVAMILACCSILPVSGNTGAVSRPDTSAASRADTTRAGIIAMVSSLTPEGWEMYDDVLYFTPENIYEQINGRAEYYLAYDMVGMFFASFESTSETSQFIDLSLFDMGTPTNAFGAFSAQRSIGLPTAKLGRESYRTGAHQYIWIGQYYLQIIASDATDLSQELTTRMASELVEVLHDSGEPVWGLGALSTVDLVRGSEQYFLVDAMGLDFMRNTYMARYLKAGSEVSVFLSQVDSPDAAETVVARFHEHATKYGENIDRLAKEGYDLVVGDMGGAYDVFTTKGRLVLGAYGVENQDMAVRATIDLINAPGRIDLYGRLSRARQVCGGDILCMLNIGHIDFA